MGENTVRGQILAEINNKAGPQAGLEVQDMLQNAIRPTITFTMQIISIIILLFSASAIFSEIQAGINTIWGVKSNPNKKWFSFIISRFLSFAMVLISAFLLLISIVITTFLAALSSHINYFIGTSIFLELIMSYCFSFIMATMLFAIIFQHLPDVKLHLGHVWRGALITALLFSLGKIRIGFYLNHAHIASVFGAAVSLIVLLIWVYYSAQIFFLGAEITKIYATKKNIKITPRRNAYRGNS